MKKLFFLFMILVCSRYVNGQTHDYNIKINPAHDADSVYILSTANSGAFAGRGRFKSLPVIASLLRPYTGHIDTAYIATDTLVLITIEGDTINFNGGSVIDTMYTNDGDSVVLYLSDNSFFGAGIAHHFTTAWDATNAQLVLSTPQDHSGGDFTIAEGSGIDLSTSGTSSSTTTTISATDASTTNEIQDITLTGSSQPFTIDLSSDATDVTITGAGITTATRTGNALTLTSTEVDGSTSNEIQTLSASGSTTTYPINLSLGGSTVTLKEGANITIDRTVDTLTINSTGSALTYSTYNVSDATSHTYGLTDSESDPHGSVTLVEGTGIGLATTGTVDDGVVTITNTGDTNAADDVLVSDTASMLSHYIERGDTASMLLHYIERGDTASMLSHYLERGDSFGGDVSGTYDNLQIGTGVVGTTEIATDGVGSAEITADAVGSSELASTAVTPGSYTLTSLTVDADGRITAASSGTVSGADETYGSGWDGDTGVPEKDDVYDADFYNKDEKRIYAALGSAIKCIAYGTGEAGAGSSLTDGRAIYYAVYIPTTMTITGVSVFMVTQGSYTADQKNYVGLYSYSAGTMTQVAISSNNGNLWKAASNSLIKEPFTATYAADPGIYFIGLLYNSSAQSTAPSIAIRGLGGFVTNFTSLDFSNSAKLSSTVNTQNTLPSSQAMSGTTASTAVYWMGLY